MIRRLRTVLAAAAIVSVLAPAAGTGRMTAQVVDPAYLDARRLFDALDYESAIRVLDQLVAGLVTRGRQDPTRKEVLPGAFEMRARSKFGLGDQGGAKADFILMLSENPAYMLSGQVSPRVIALFDEAALETVTTLALTVTPAAAKVTIDGVAVAPGPAIPIALGEHAIAAEQPGYRSVQQLVMAAAGQPAEVTLALERISSIVSVLTTPSDVEVTIDGVRRGRTAAGPPSANYADAIARAGTPAAQVSAAMVINDLPIGPHVVALSRDCHVRVETRIEMGKPDDYVIGPIALARAVASLSVAANQPGAQVFIDGQARGVAPYTTSDLCEGPYIAEVRSASGRDIKRGQARPGDKISFEGVIKPALALVSAGDTAAAADADLRSAVETAFGTVPTLMLFAPPADQTQQALKASQVQAGWLSADPTRRPIGAPADMAALRDMSTRLAAAFSAQGVASVTPLDRNRVALSLLAAGSGRPDIVEVRLDTPGSITAIVERLTRPLSMFGSSIGLSAVDVADVPGPVVVSVDSNGPAARAGVQVGEVVVTIDGQPVADAAALAIQIARKGTAGAMKMELKTRAGAAKPVEISAVTTPRVIGLADQGLLVNPILLDLRARLQQAPADSPEAAVIRLNTAVALTRVGAWSEAQVELRKVKLPDGPGVGNGTIQYLLGLCAAELGNLAEAEMALAAAAASDSLVSEDGPPVKELAEATLAQLRGRAGTPPR